MLLIKGTKVSFKLIDGTKLSAPAAYGMIHDDTGRDWPSRSVLIGPFVKTSERLPESAEKPDLDYATALGYTLAGAASGAIIGALIGGATNRNAGATLGGVLGSIAVGAFALNAAGTNSLSRYLGTTYQAHVADVRVEGLPRDARDWTYVGELEEILYQRSGNRAPDYFFHPFAKPVSLFRHRGWYRVELPRGAVLNERGFVWP